MTSHPEGVKGRARGKATVEDIGAKKKKKRKSGIPTGHAGEYFVMGELLRRGFDAQLADRNTKGYDILIVGRAGKTALQKVQVKTVRMWPWFVNLADFEKDRLRLTTIYVLLGREDARRPVRYFIAKNRAIKRHVNTPPGWKNNGYVGLKPLHRHEDRWDLLGLD